MWEKRESLTANDKFSHFAQNDMREGWIASHCFSNRREDPFCAFGAPLL